MYIYIYLSKLRCMDAADPKIRTVSHWVEADITSEGHIVLPSPTGGEELERSIGLIVLILIRAPCDTK